MENKIEVGEYVRTKKGRIDKVERFSAGLGIWHCENGMCIDECNCVGTHLEDIVNHSKQLIDLIENKDVLKVRSDKTILFLGIDECTSDIKYKELIESIKNGEYELLEILTHEQFEANCYKIGGEDGI
jgi:hypothetical protein|nr:MAG TPA: hypothetical protein [Caudoviricetes sp.]